MKHSSRRYADPPFPRDLAGRDRPDPFFRGLERLLNGLQPVMARLGGAKYPDGGASGAGRELPMRVAAVDRPAEDVAALRLEPEDGSPVRPWQPGWHLDLVLSSGAVRQYSLCGDPADRAGYRIAVRRIPGGSGSGEVHALEPGARVAVRGPRNAFPFARADRYVFIAGGIGITPILPMAKAAARRGAPFRLVYTGRSRAALPFLDELPSSPSGTVEVRSDDADGVPGGAELLGAPEAGTAVYCCGPPPMIDAVRSALPDHPSLPFFWERFSPPPVRGGVPFEVELARSGRVLTVPADRSALDAVRDAVPDVAYSCRQGFCGTCRVPLLSGTDDTVALCVSRTDGGRLVVDL
ncbi:PDR/VanB family oxidoreductase [Nocardiopsis suaedae]|uniref:PDR/VanB family oxidoreductase n=1 Tax=Nocardiopsis suaedae TaxID=3018444 RepID=A0ABT4TQ02_9ACTN|nr:PDR/VanB family oxidoreductase [Nocardiopsis suaedae]MDA2806436.1 PDR/VanB family oxidoreductase [Nocardiopsis suaedae]